MSDEPIEGNGPEIDGKAVDVVSNSGNVETIEGARVIQTDVGAKDGQNKCPNCGATDISLNAKKGVLRCNYCRTEFEPEKVEGLETDISKLKGEIIGSAAQNIDKDFDSSITLKCSSCGAEVVVDTETSTQARCHWCRHTLSINQQVPNGSVPDVVLPFKLSKKDAKEIINGFVGKRKFFAKTTFKNEFTTENIMGVYFPYMIVDVNSHADFDGQGEHETRRYTVSRGDSKETRYDADLYDVGREFYLTIEGLTVESSLDKLNISNNDKTNNVINAIMPFDIENCVKWNSNYLKGYTSEKRDADVEDLRKLVNTQAKDIARFAANDTISFYDRGVCWQKEDFDIHGMQWKTAYLPVWLYSYYEKNGGKSLLHYIAVNARTKEVMGSVPINMPKLFLVASAIAGGGIWISRTIESKYAGAAVLLAIAFFVFTFFKYRNNNKRHHYEKETKRTMTGLEKLDRFVEKRKGLSNSQIKGANNKRVKGVFAGDDIVSKINKVSKK